MDAGKVKVLLDCLEEGSMMRAAEKLGYTPSGLTHMMDALERDLGVQVIERGRYGIRLTENGQKLLPFMKDLAGAERRLLSAAENLTQGEERVVRVGSYNSMARNWLPQIMLRFQEEHPDCRVELAVLTRDNCYEALSSGRVDLLFACQNESYDYVFRPLKKDKYLAVLPKGVYTPENGVFPLKDVEKLPFIVPAYGRDKDVLNILKENHLHPQQLSLYSDNVSIVSMVAGGLGMTILPELVMRGYLAEVDMLPLEPEIFRLIGLIYPSPEGLTEAEQLFVEHVIRSQPN